MPCAPCPPKPARHGLAASTMSGGKDSEESSGLGAVVWRQIVKVNTVLTVLGYPMGIPIILTSYQAPSARGARVMRRQIALCWALASGGFYSYALFLRNNSGSLLTRCLSHFFWFWCVDAPLFWFVTGGVLIEKVLDRKVCTNRLFSQEKKPEFKGKRIVILGNGPSLAAGEPLGDVIDSMDEVIRFNNFQTKQSGLEQWTGHKTTVHFSDGMLYPSHPKYHVPGACVVLSLFMDRLIIAGSYLLFRMAVDLEIRAAWDMMLDPDLGWIPHEDIQALKKTLGIRPWKHPTSGVLAIDWFVRHRPDPSTPVYIHGFDFFQGKQIHYYDKTEPLYERINDLAGVSLMHEPHKERSFVDKLVSEGHVRWLRDAKELKK